MSSGITNTKASAMATNVIAVKADKPSLEDNIVTLLIGEKRTPSILHGKVLAQRLKGRAIPDLQRDSNGRVSILLSTSSTAAYELWLQFVHTDRLPLWQHKPTGNEQDRIIQDAFDALIEFYSFAMAIADRDAAVAAIIGIEELSRKRPYGCEGSLLGTASVAKVYSLTKSGSSLRRALVQIYSEDADPEKIDSRLPAEFVVDVARAALSKIKSLEEAEEDGNVAAEKSDAALVSCSSEDRARSNQETRKRKVAASPDAQLDSGHGSKKRKLGEIDLKNSGTELTKLRPASNVALVPSMRLGNSKMLQLNFVPLEWSIGGYRQWSSHEVGLLAAAYRALVNPDPRPYGVLRVVRNVPICSVPNFKATIHGTVSGQHLSLGCARYLILTMLSLDEDSTKFDLDKFREDGRPNQSRLLQQRGIS